MHAMISKANVQRFSATAREFHNKVVARAFGKKTVPCLEHEDVTALNTVISSVQLSTVMFCFCSCQSVCSVNGVQCNKCLTVGKTIKTTSINSIYLFNACVSS